MLDIMNAFNSELGNLPVWVQIWLKILVGVLALSVPFAFVRREAVWTVLALIGGVAAVMFLYSQFGMQRILGLGHILFWTPLIVYLLKRRAHWRVAGTWAGKWIVAAVIVLAISLAFDFVDVGRWLMGNKI